MRRILFRGIPKREMDFDFYRRAFPFPGNTYDGSFALGSLLVDEDNGRAYICGSAIIAMNCTVGNAQCSAIEVEPVTVGQFIGLLDKNGRKIFEGDIVMKRTYHGKKPCKVVFSFGCFHCGFGGGSSTATHPYFLDDSQIEVIGNIHDNPEMLEVMQNG